MADDTQYVAEAKQMGEAAAEMLRIATDAGVEPDADHEEVFFAWMADKYRLPHQAKIIQAYFDAISNSGILRNFYRVLGAFKKITVKAGRMSFLRRETIDKLAKMISSYDVKLPHEEDIIQKPGADLDAKQERVLNTIYSHATRIIEFVLELHATAINDALPKAERAIAKTEIEALEAIGFLKSLRAVDDGICHHSIAQNLATHLRKANVMQ